MEKRKWRELFFFFLWPLLRNDRRREEKECGGGVSPSLLPHFSPMNVRKGSAFLAFGFFFVVVVSSLVHTFLRLTPSCLAGD